MKEKIFSIKCAEAQVIQIEFDGKKAILKKRIKKNYRANELDDLIIKRRTKSEAKLIKTLKNIVLVPEIYSVNQSEIIMEFIEGDQLKKIIEKQPNLCILAGKEIKKIHGEGIIHGDLTTSNIMLKKSIPSKLGGNELVFIDFGLGYFSKKIEDKATDLIVFKKTFNATHSKIKNGWELVMQGYKPSVELKTRMQAIEKRARYH
ncbi:MAG: KEOPS complex kinase/ATPase Bud32 [archaeon]|jgi:Kae1-associated kinase Bud32